MIRMFEPRHFFDPYPYIVVYYPICIVAMHECVMDVLERPHLDDDDDDGIPFDNIVSGRTNYYIHLEWCSWRNRRVFVSYDTDSFGSHCHGRCCCCCYPDQCHDHRRDG